MWGLGGNVDALNVLAYHRDPEKGTSVCQTASFEPTLACATLIQ